MVTGRHVCGPEGHQWSKNTDPSKGETLHQHRGYEGAYIASVFDVVHDHGLRTAMFAGKSKFTLYRDSYDAKHGAADPGQPDHGRNKIDCFVVDNCDSMTRRYLAAMQEKPIQYAFLHYADPDSAGHRKGWGSEAYQEAIRKVDAQLGRIFAMIDGTAKFRGKTTIF